MPTETVSWSDKPDNDNCSPNSGTIAPGPTNDGTRTPDSSARQSPDGARDRDAPDIFDERFERPANAKECGPRYS